MKSSNHIRAKNAWPWAIIGGLIGFFLIHPVVMITAHIMFMQGLETNYSIVGIITSEYTKVFSIQMLPWGISFALFSTIAGLFFGRNLQMTYALQKSQQRFKELSITDDLTGLYNSRHFFSRLTQEIERTNRYGHPLSLLILDVDNFKEYNDTYGHMVGDGVLTRIGEILRKSLRNTDSAHRYGGEEFTIILPETESRDAVHFAERLRASFANQDFSIQNLGNLSVTASIGVAQYKEREEMTAFIKRADNYLYVAKKKGKNRVYFSQ